MSQSTITIIANSQYNTVGADFHIEMCNHADDEINSIITLLEQTLHSSFAQARSAMYLISEDPYVNIPLVIEKLSNMGYSVAAGSVIGSSFTTELANLANNSNVIWGIDQQEDGSFDYESQPTNIVLEKAKI